MVTSIRSVPEELLAAIFALVLEPGVHRFARTRTTLALVSRDWNRTIYETPSFWTSIDGSQSRQQVDLSLQHSQQASLKVRFDSMDFYHEDGLKNFEEVCRHRSRWGSAQFPLRGEPSTWTWLANPAPLVEHISLLGCPGADVDLFRGDAPRLRSVRLMKLSIPWSGSMLAGLTVLDLAEIEWNAPSVQEMASILQASPDLKILALHSIHFPFPDALSHPSSIHFPHLESLTLSKMDSEIIQYFLTVIQSPPCRLAVTCVMGREGDVAHLSGIARFITPIPLSTQPATLRVGPKSIWYSHIHTGDPAIELELGFLTASVLLQFLASIPLAQYLALETNIMVENDKSPSIYTIDNIRPIVRALAFLNITGIEVRLRDTALAVNGLLYELTTPSAEGGKWSFPALHDLSVDLRAVPTIALNNMLRGQYGVGRTGITGLPVPFTRLTIAGGSRADEQEFAAIKGGPP